MSRAEYERLLRHRPGVEYNGRVVAQKDSTLVDALHFLHPMPVEFRAQRCTEISHHPQIGPG